MHSVLILGGSGLVGKALIREMNAHENYEVYATWNDHLIPWYKEKSCRLNVNTPDDIDNLLDNLKPQSIISCLRGDFDKQLALHAKAAEYLRQCGGMMYYCSTANVFDSDYSRPHYEDDMPDSDSDYGQFKIECEKKIIDILHENACILRLPMMFGKQCRRVNELVEFVSDNREIEVYPNIFVNTNTDTNLAKQINYIIKNNLKGIFHLAAEDMISYKDLYVSLSKALGYENVNIKENLEEKGYLALLSKRSSEFADDLRITNGSVIDYLVD